ncbi:MFS transporter [Actinomycetota bacterium]
MKQTLHESLWRVRDVRIVVPAAVLAGTGTVMLQVGLLLRVHDGEGRPDAVTALLVAFALPAVAVMGLAGELADRVDSRRLLVVTGLAQCAAAAGLSALGGLGATVALVVVFQLAFAIGNPAWSALTSTLVPREQLG